jgi:hypothetical protein
MRILSRLQAQSNQTQSNQTQSKLSLYFYLALAIAFYFGLLSCLHGLSSDYLVQDDARQGVVWLEKWVDANLFPKDDIADYALGQSNNSLGVKWLYELGVAARIRPMLLAKFVPLVLGIFASGFYFRLCLKVFPSNFCAFTSTVIFSQNIWMNDDVVSATPRAFLYPIFAGFLYCVTSRKFLPSLVFTALQTLFYPPFVLVHLCILGLRCADWSARPLPFSKSKQPYQWAIASLCVALILLWPILNHGGDAYGALVTHQQMAAMPEFARNGRTPFFINDPLEFWFSGTSGLNTPVYPYAIWLAYLCPWALRREQKIVRSSGKFSNAIDTAILGQIGGAALILFFAAHLVLFKLYWPSRYPYHAFPFLFSIGAGIVITLALTKLRASLRNGRLMALSLWRRGLVLLTTVMVALLLALPFVPSISLGFQGWIRGTAPEIYRFLAQQPKNAMTVGLGEETSNIPSFALRSVLFSREVAIPFHLKHYGKMRDRISRVLEAQYSADPKALQSAIRDYGIDYWLVDRIAFTPRYLSKKGNDWLLQFQPQADQARRSLEAGVVPAIVPLMESCPAAKTDTIVLLDAACMLRQA